jgi:uncharacterized protein YoxC
MDPLFWLGLSILLVAVSLTALLVVAIPAFQELGRAARSAEKLFDTLNRELPPTLEAIRLTGLEISELTDDVSQGVQSAGQVAKQVDQSLGEVKQQAQRVQTTTRSVFAGVKAAWRTLTGPEPTARSRRSREGDGQRQRLPASTRSPLETPPLPPAEPRRDSPLPVAPPTTHLAYPETSLRISAADSNGSTPEPVEDSNWPPPTPQAGRNPHKAPPEPRERDYRSESRPPRRPPEND